MHTETITWHPVSDALPDAETNVLLTVAGDEPGTLEGFLDGEWPDGRPLFRDVTAAPIFAGDVTHWAAMPAGAISIIDAQTGGNEGHQGSSLASTVQERALDACRLYASKHRKEEWAKVILQFCAEGGSTPSPLRAVLHPVASPPDTASDGVTGGSNAA